MENGLLVGHMAVLSWAIADIWAHLIKTGAATKLDAAISIEKLVADAKRIYPNEPGAADLAVLIADQLSEKTSHPDSPPQ